MKSDPVSPFASVEKVRKIGGFSAITRKVTWILQHLRHQWKGLIKTVILTPKTTPWDANQWCRVPNRAENGPKMAFASVKITKNWPTSARDCVKSIIARLLKFCMVLDMVLAFPEHILDWRYLANWRNARKPLNASFSDFFSSKIGKNGQKTFFLIISGGTHQKPKMSIHGLNTAKHP